MIELSADSFHDALVAHGMVVCVLHHGSFEDWVETVSAICGRSASAGPWAWARLDVAAAPTVAKMFDVSDGEAKLLIMRERVVLYCELLVGTSSEVTGSIIDRAARLDMTHVREDIEQEHLSRESLFNRRVCPTAKRTRT